MLSAAPPFVRWIHRSPENFHSNWPATLSFDAFIVSSFYKLFTMNQIVDDLRGYVALGRAIHFR